MRKIRSISITLTAEKFKELVGEQPVNDDLERISCEAAGTSGHHFCGWNSCKEVPMYQSDTHKEGCSCNQNMFLEDR